MSGNGRKPYVLGALHEKCSQCDWQQSGHRVEWPHCPRCGAPTDPRSVALEFGGLHVTFDGTRFSLRDRLGGYLEVDEGDYPDTILFMQRHARPVYPPPPHD